MHLSIRRQVIVASTLVLALTLPSCSGVSAFPNLFATETPTPTNTFTPTPTPTLTPSPTSTSTSTPSPTPAPTGIGVDQQIDGSTLFTDYDNKYRLMLPDDWLVIPFRKDAFAEAVNKLAKENPQLAAAAEAFQNMDPSMFRLVAINTNAKYLKNRFASNLNITAYGDPILSSMPLSFVTGALEEQFKQSGIKVVTKGVNIIENSRGVDVEYIDTEQTAAGSKIVQRVLVFQTKDKLVMIAITTLPQFSKDVFAEGDIIGGSIELLK